MKTNKKAILSAVAVLGVAGLVAGGTVAYFTDKKETTNTFTVGDVKISLYESQLHRQNSGRRGAFDHTLSDPDYCTYTGIDVDNNTGAGPQPTNQYESARYCTPLMNAGEGDRGTISALKNGHVTHASRTWGYKDETIEADAETYKATDDPATTDVDESGYFTRVSQNIVPGQWIRKFTYVKNEDASSDAYVLIRYMVPTEYADKVELKIPGTPYEEDARADIDGHQGYFTALTRQLKSGSTTDYEYVAYDSSAKDSMDFYTPYTETIHDEATDTDIIYKVYAAVTTDALEPGEMTFWSPVNTVRLTKDSEVADFDYSNGNPLVQVKVDAQAIQAKTFSDAIEAINSL